MRSKLTMVLVVLCVEPALAAAPLMTEWGERVTSENAWREYPRPQMIRENWTNLNGDWDYAITSVTNTPGRPEKWNGRIRVPFALEAALSGVGRALEPDQFLWYTRRIVCTRRPGERTLLHFGAVDFRTMVFIGHDEVTEVPHEGGQTPFTLDITDYVKDGENELTVCVWDPTEDFVNSRGKQSFKPHGCFYTRVSGIWQTVWMETVPERYVAGYRVETDIDAGTVRIEVEVKGRGEGRTEISVFDAAGNKVGDMTPVSSSSFTINLPSPHLWSPDDPYLYTFTVSCGRDRVRGYFGMRKFAKAKDKNGVLRFFLNNRPYYVMATLDQGWWPDGLLTPPSEEAMEFDIRTLKDCGFNAMRKHIKVEPMRYYALCDRLGMLVIQDLPSGEGKWDAPLRVETTARYGMQRKEQKEMMDLLQAVPSIVMWTPYNEGWSQPGEFLTHSMLDFVRRYDATRLVNGPSGCWDWEGGHLLPKGWAWTNRVETAHRPAGTCEAADAVDLHLYRGPGMLAVNDRRITFLGEFGGLGHAVEGHCPGEGLWGYGGTSDTSTREGLERVYLAMMAQLGDLAERGLGGSVYTQTTDVEIEINGLMTYDRKVLKFDPAVLRKAHSEVIRRALGGKPAAQSFGRLADGRETHLWRLRSRDGLVVDVSDYGGRIVRVLAPDRFGKLADVTIGFNSAGECEKYGFCVGTLIGRYGNRIADGTFVLDGRRVTLPLNEVSNGRHCNLHGGPEGWDEKVWAAKPFSVGDEQGIELSLVSPDGDMGFPGTVTAKVTYRVGPGNTIGIDYEATTDRPTVINLTHHGYWNLAGEASGDVLGQELQIFADSFTKTDAGLIPTEIAPVEGTGFDFRQMRAIGKGMDWMLAQEYLKPTGNWYDHNFVLRGKTGELHPALRMRDPVSGRTLEVSTTEPCLQVYGGQDFSAKIPAKAPGRRLVKFGGLALETQHFPDSPNRPDFPSTVLRPGETFRSRTVYSFGVDAAREAQPAQADESAVRPPARADYTVPNYDESKVPPYELEDPLSFADGRKLSGPADWPARRAEILEIFAHEMYGVEPPGPEAVVVEKFDEAVTMGGFGIRRQYRMWFRKDRTGPAIDWLVLVPRHEKRPVPVVMLLNYGGNHELIRDPEVRIPEGVWMQFRAGFKAEPDKRGCYENMNDKNFCFPAHMILARGYAVVTACYAQISPDPDMIEKPAGQPDAYTMVFDLWPKRDETREDNITSLGAWAWTLSRGLDMVEGIPELDATRTIATGYSRLAKAALLAAARDTRFAVCVANQTGGGGCPLAKRDFGENVGNEMVNFPHWYCRAYGKYRTDPARLLTFDQHLLLAAIAPRRLLVQGFNDKWFDTKGEFLACKAASPVWTFLGLGGMPSMEFPDDFDTSCIGPDFGYVRRAEEHGISSYDWTWMLDFADRTLCPDRKRPSPRSGK